jgi:Asp-tRNA(Asn)/Glu-tRNA(Gln) amidotransferase A subunit family amidase
MVALAPSFDTVGWLTKDLNTLAHVADVLLPTDVAQSHASINYNLINAVDLIHVSEHQSQILHCIEQLKGHAHFTFSDTSTLFSPNNLALAAEAFRVLQAFEIWQTHGDWINKHKPIFAQDIQSRFAASAKITRDQYTTALAFQANFKHRIDQLFEQQDFILLPTTPGRAPLSTSSPSDLLAYRTSLMSMTCIAGLTGLPQLHLPLGLYQGRPTGMSLIGKRHGDKSLFVAAKKIMEILN